MKRPKTNAQYKYMETLWNSNKIINNDAGWTADKMRNRCWSLDLTHE